MIRKLQRENEKRNAQYSVGSSCDVIPVHAHDEGWTFGDSDCHIDGFCGNTTASSIGVHSEAAHGLSHHGGVVVVLA